MKLAFINLEIESISPLNISDGEDLLIIDSDKALLSATTIAGGFRSYLREKEKETSNLFGDNKNTESNSQSRIYIKDSIATIKKINRRTNIKIDGKSGSSSDNSKRDTNVFEKGIVFKIEMKIENYVEEDKNLIYSCIRGIEESLIRFGGDKSNGFGVFKVKEIKEKDIDLSNMKDLEKYLNKDMGNYKDIKDEVLKEEKNNFYKFNIKGSLTTPTLIGVSDSTIYSDDASDTIKNKSEKSQKSGNEYIIPGSSFKGIIRSRMEKIANLKDKENIVKEYFGETKEKEEKNSLSRIFFNESIIENSKDDTIYYTIKIDKFTGGVMKTALVNEAPVTGDIEFEIIFKPKGDEEKDKYIVGILLFALRDLGIGDISIGSKESIGRGRYRASNLTMKYLDENLEVDFKEGKVSDEKILEKYIKEVYR